MPTTGTKLYRYDGEWRVVYAELFDDEQKKGIIDAFNASLDATGFKPEQTWGERIEDRGSQITFSALGQEAPIEAKEHWDPDFAKRKVIQADLKQRLPGLSINMLGNKRVSHLASLAKYAVAFFKMSRSSVTRANSRFNWRISASLLASPNTTFANCFFHAYSECGLTPRRCETSATG